MWKRNGSLYLEKIAAWPLNYRMSLISALRGIYLLTVSVRFWRSGKFFDVKANPKTPFLTLLNLSSKMLALHHWWVVSYNVLLHLVVMICCKISCIYNKSLVVLLKIRILDRFFFMICNKISGALWWNTLQLQNWG